MKRNAFQRFSLWREQQATKLARYKPVVIAGCTVLLVFSMATIVWSMLGESAPPARATYAYYYDLNANETFIREWQNNLPVEAPSGPLESGGKAGVHAHIYSCGSCDGDVWLAYLSMERPLTPAEQKRAEDQGIYPPTELIADPENLQWVDAASYEAIQLIDATCSDGQRAVECGPTEEEVEQAGL